MKLLFILIQLNPVSYILNGKTAAPDPNFYRIGIWAVDENRVNQLAYKDFVDSIRSLPAKSVILTLNNHKNFHPGPNGESDKTIKLIKAIRDQVYIVQLGNEIDRYFTIKKNLTDKSLKTALEKFVNDSYLFSQNLSKDSIDTKLCLSFSNRSMIDPQLNKAMGLILDEIKAKAPNCFDFIDFHHHNHSDKVSEFQALINQFKTEIAAHGFDKIRLIMTENSTWTLSPYKSRDSMLRLEYQSEEDQASFLAKSVGLALASDFEIVFMGIAKDRQSYGLNFRPSRFHYNGLSYNDSLTYSEQNNRGPKISAYLYAIFDRFFENANTSQFNFETIGGYQLITYDGDQPVVLVWSDQREGVREENKLIEFLNRFLVQYRVYDLNTLDKYRVPIEKIYDSHMSLSEDMYQELMNERSVPLILIGQNEDKSF